MKHILLILATSALIAAFEDLNSIMEPRRSSKQSFPEEIVPLKMRDEAYGAKPPAGRYERQRRILPPRRGKASKFNDYPARQPLKSGRSRMWTPEPPLPTSFVPKTTTTTKMMDLMGFRGAISYIGGKHMDPGATKPVDAVKKGKLPAHGILVDRQDGEGFKYIDLQK